MSLDADDKSVEANIPPSTPPLIVEPPLDVRWVHAGSQYLDLLPTPITSASTSYKAFSYDESGRIEAKWAELTGEERSRIIRQWGQTEGEGAPKKKETKKKTEGRDRAGSSASIKSNGRSASPAPGHPIDDAVKRQDHPPTQETLRSGEEQPEETQDADLMYKDYIRNVHKDGDFEKIIGVPVSQDSLFEVSLPTLSLHPVFWAHTGPRVPVLRGSWFIGDDSRPCSWDLAEELEKAYRTIQPWQPSYKHELAQAMAIGPSAEEKLKHSLPPRFGQGLGIIFDDGEKGRLITTGAMTYISRAFWSSLRAKPSGTYVYRGFDAAPSASGKDKDDASSAGKRSGPHSRRGSSSSMPATNMEREDSLLRRTISRDIPDRPATVVGAAAKIVGVDPDQLEATANGVKQQLKASIPEPKSSKSGGPLLSEQALQEQYEPVVDDAEDAPPCTDLILVIHGIGQQLASTYESFNFVYAGNQLRQGIRHQTANPALASIVRDRRCQVLPVQWRASLLLDEEKTKEDREHSMDNRFTMADITINKSIPAVREMTNSVLLDIPLFMSHHRQKMIEAVCTQANKLYRLWVARNPDFVKNGRVHLIGHSLGSALAAHILSNQPTKMPTIDDLPHQVVCQTKDRFLFNTSNFFLVGSPLGIFLHIDQAQLMPRKGRERTMHSPPDEALDRAGKFGCLSIDSLYNVFYHTDPVAYMLNAAVDVRLAAQKKPLPITSVTAPFYAAVTTGIGNLASYIPLPSLFSSTAEDGKVRRPTAIRLPSGIEMSGPSGEERLKGSQGDRRFSALNPHGNIDFFLPGAGPSEYLDMITAHASYWADASFAAFLLAEIFSTRLDLMRTGMGLAHRSMADMDLA